MKWLKKILEEPEKFPDKSPEKILIEDRKWHPLSVETMTGRVTCLDIEFSKLKHAIWEELTK